MELIDWVRYDYLYLYVKFKCKDVGNTAQPQNLLTSTPHQINQEAILSNGIKSHIWRTTGLDSRNFDIFNAAAVLRLQ